MPDSRQPDRTVSIVLLSIGAGILLFGSFLGASFYIGYSDWFNPVVLQGRGRPEIEMALNFDSVAILDSKNRSVINQAKKNGSIVSVPEGAKTEYLESLALLNGVVVSKSDVLRLERFRPQPAFSWYLKVSIRDGSQKGRTGWVASINLGRNYPPL